MLGPVLQKISEDKAFIIHATNSLITRSLSALGIIILSFALATVNGAEGVGQVMLTLSILVGLSTVARFGFDTAILKHAGIAVHDKNYIDFVVIQQKAIKISGVLSTCISGVILLFEDTIASLLNLNLNLLVIAILLPLFSVMYIQAALMKALGRSIYAPIFELGGIAFVVSCVVLFMHAYEIHVGIENLFTVMACLVAGVVCLGFFSINKIVCQVFGSERHNTTSTQVTDLIRTLPDYASMSILSYLLQWGWLLLLGAMLTAEDVGVFSVVQRLAMAANIVLVVFNGILAPKIAALYAKKNNDDLQNLVKRSTVYMLLVSWPLLFTFIIFPREWLILFGDEFVYASSMLVLLACAQLVNIAAGSVGFILTMSGYQKIMRNISACAGLGGILMAALLIHYIDIYGAAVAYCCVVIAQNVTASYFVKKKIGFIPLISGRVFNA